MDKAINQISRYIIGDPEDGYTLCHDRFKKYLAEGNIKDLVVKYNQRMLYYCARWKDHKSAYALKHFAAHLYEAEKWIELQGLFANDAWLQGRVANDGYQYSGYLDDLQRAWEHAYQECRAQIETGQPLTKIVDCIHLALIQTSINSLSANYVPAIVARAVALGVKGWTTERAFSMAMRIPDAEKRFGMLYVLVGMNRRESCRRLG